MLHNIKNIKNIKYHPSCIIAKFIFVSSLLIFSGIGSAADDDSKKGNATRGAKEWAGNCSRCHNMRDPKEFRDDTWRLIVSHMRVRGGFTGQQIRDILAFLQSSNYTPTTVASTTKESATPSVGQSGEQIYEQTCIACHGPNGQGTIPGVPKFSDRLSKEDENLLNSITNGFQTEGSPMAMPAKGGNSSLTDADIKEVLSYIRQSFGQ
jgi:mono/diheme cytochrome c family protein